MLAEGNTPTSPRDASVLSRLGYPPARALLARGFATVVLLFVPLVVARALLPHWASAPATLSVIGAGIAIGGSRTFVVGLQVVLAVLVSCASDFAGNTWILTSLVAAACVVGVRAHRTHSGAFATAPLIVASIGWTPMPAPPVGIGAVLLGSMLWGLACLEVLGIRRPARGASAEEVHAFARFVPATIAALAAIGSALELPHGAWLVGTAALLVRPEVERTRARSVNRVIGTIVGIALASIVTPLGRDAALAAAFVCAVHMVAYALAADYLRQTAFATPFTLLMLAAVSPHAPWQVFLERLAWNVLAALVAFALSAAQAHALRQMGAEHSPKVS